MVVRSTRGAKELCAPHSSSRITEYGQDNVLFQDTVDNSATLRSSVGLSSAITVHPESLFDGVVACAVLKFYRQNGGEKQTVTDS